MENLNTYFIDLDGTLCDQGRYVSAKNILKIREMLKQKTNIILSTGRLDTSVQRIMEVTGVPYAITGNGSKIINKKGKVLKEFPIEKRALYKALQILKKHNLLVRIDGDLSLYGTRTLIDKQIAKFATMFPVHHYSFDKEIPHFKITSFGKSKSKIASVIAELEEKVPNVNVTSSYHDFSIEITSKQASKGLALQYVSKQILKLKNNKSVAHIGDSMNDASTKKYAKLIVMKNGSKKLKKMADYLGPHYKKHGVAKVLDGEITEPPTTA